MSELHRRGLAEGRTIDGRAFDAAHHVQITGRSTMQTDETLELGGQTPEPDAPPASTGDTSLGVGDGASIPAPDPQPGDQPRKPTGRLRIGEHTKGRYVVLWARKPGRGDDARPAYQEVDVIEASSPEYAKRAVMADGAPFAEFLRHSAAQKPGILLRAVPAMHWPDTVNPTTYERPAPVLTIG